MSGFASAKDLADKTMSFEDLGPGLYGYTAEGDPNSGVVIGDRSVLVVDAQATPKMAEDVLARIRQVTDKPVHHVVLSHYHAVRVLGASAYANAEIIASDVTRDLIVERGKQDMDSEIGRFPRLFRGKESIPGLTWPHVVFHKRMTLWLGEREVQIIHIGRSHTAGDTIVWLPEEKVLFAGDSIEFGATPYSWRRAFCRLAPHPSRYARWDRSFWCRGADAVSVAVRKSRRRSAGRSRLRPICSPSLRLVLPKAQP